MITEEREAVGATTMINEAECRGEVEASCRTCGTVSAPPPPEDPHANLQEVLSRIEYPYRWCVNCQTTTWHVWYRVERSNEPTSLEALAEEHIAHVTEVQRLETEVQRLETALAQAAGDLLGARNRVMAALQVNNPKVGEKSS